MIVLDGSPVITTGWLYYATEYIQRFSGAHICTEFKVGPAFLIYHVSRTDGRGWIDKDKRNMKTQTPLTETYKSPICKVLIVNIDNVLCQSQTEHTGEEDLF